MFFLKQKPNFVGVVTAIDFGSNLSVSPVSSGIVTISSSGGGGDYANIAGIVIVKLVQWQRAMK